MIKTDNGIIIYTERYGYPRSGGYYGRMPLGNFILFETEDAYNEVFNETIKDLKDNNIF